MSKLIKSIAPETLQSWGIDPNAQIEYYDGTILVVDGSEPEGGISLMIKAGTAALFGVAVFSNAPLVGATMFLYAGYKVVSTVKSLYGGNNSLTSRIEADLSGEDVPDGWVPMPQLPEEHQPVRITTQLGEPSAINVTSQPISNQFASNWQNPTTQATIDYTQQMREVIDRNNSFYIGGSKGSGKGMFAANLLRWKLEQYPSAIAFVLDPKGDAKESGYWEHPRIKRFAFKGILLNKVAYAVKVAEFLSEARNLVSQADIARGMRLFLVFDELLALKTKLDKPVFEELSSFGAEAISTGDSAGIHVIAITQSFNAGDSFGSDEVLKNFTQVGLFREDEYMRAKKQVNQNRTNAALEQAEFNQLAKQSPVKRVMQIAGDFIPTPKLTNYSAYDRDSGEVIKPMPLGSNPSEGDQLAEQLKAEVAKRSPTTAANSTTQSRDRFEQFAALLTHESQATLKAFVLWLSKKKEQEVTFDQIKDSFARNAGIPRSREAIDPLLQIAILQKLIEVLPNNNWWVRGD